jgi:cytochrome P450
VTRTRAHAHAHSHALACTCTHIVEPTTYFHTTQDFELCGFRVPTDWRVFLLIGATQRAVPEWLGDAGAFRPERFLAPAQPPRAGDGSGTGVSSLLTI